jgi:hypothetical protein
MSWLELDDLQRRILTSLYQPVRSQRMVESKRAGTGRRRNEQGRLLRPQFAQEVGAALGLGAHRFQALQDMVAALNKGKALDEELYNQMLSRLLEVEQVEGKIYMGTRMLRDMVRRYQRGAKDVAPDKRAAKEQEQTIRGIVNVLEHVGKEATAFTRDVAMNPSVSRDAVAAVLADMNKFRYSMRPFVQKLNEFLAEQNKEREA